MSMKAIVREVSPALLQCELTFVEREPIDLPRARAQHQAYIQALEASGISVIAMPPDPVLPDAVFIEDAAVILDEIAVMTRPGAITRRQEVAAVADVIGQYRTLEYIAEPGTLDGGDVLRIGRTYFVGLSSRTNQEGARQFAAIATNAGYEVKEIPVTGCLHLKTAVTHLSNDLILINPAWVDRSFFDDYLCLKVDPHEPFAANCLLLDGVAHVSASWPRTRRLLEECGLPTVCLEIREFEKAEAGLTCLSLVFNDSRELPV